MPTSLKTCSYGILEHTKMIDQAFDSHFYFENRTEMDIAAEKGHFEILRFLHENAYGNCTSSAIDYAAQNGYLHIVEYLHFNRDEGCSTTAIDDAAWNGHKDIVRFLGDHRTEGGTIRAIEGCLRRSDFELLQFLLSKSLVGDGYKAMPIAKSLIVDVLYVRLLRKVKHERSCKG